MSNQSPSHVQPVERDRLAHFQKQLRATLSVFAVLLVMLALTVGASYANLAKPWNIVVALLIATTQALLSAVVFMHLRTEKPMVFWVLLITGVFLVGLLSLTLGSFANAVTPSHVP